MSAPIESLPRPELERRYRRVRALSFGLAALTVVSLVVSGVLWTKQPGPTSASVAGGSATAETPEQAPAGPTSLERRDPADPMAIGDIDAPVVLSEWVDMRCPFCAVYSRDVLPVLQREYVDTGKLRIEMHDAAFFGEESLRAAAAARAAGEQGLYPEFVAAMFEAAPESGHPDLPPEELIAFAKQVGVKDIQKFTADMNSAELRAAVEQSTALAQQVGVQGVPFFAINGQAMSGAQPIETFRNFIDQEIAASEAAAK